MVIKFVDSKSNVTIKVEISLQYFLGSSSKVLMRSNRLLSVLRCTNKLCAV